MNDPILATLFSYDFWENRRLLGVDRPTDWHPFGWMLSTRDPI